MSFENILKDLDDLDDNDEGSDGIDGYSKNIDDLNSGSEDDMNDENGIEDQEQDLVQIVTAKLASSIGHFRKSSKYKKRLYDIKEATEGKLISSQKLSTLESDESYNLILECNRFIHEIDDEIAETHRFVVEVYAKKFPELESLIPNKIDYIKTVLRIKNETDMTLVELNDILPSATVMVVSVTGSTTSGKELNEDDLSNCLKACEEVLMLVEDKQLVLQFVESQMNSLAPNLCALIGSRISAQLIGLSGGVVALSKIPACNVEVMGQEKRHLAGFSNASALPHTGVLYQCDLVQGCPHSIRRKILSVLANKVVLLARVDSYASKQDKNSVSQGMKIRQELEEKIEKLLEPPKARTKKALPVPEEKKRTSRRGGKRVRRMKERYAMTELRSQQNKLSFSMNEGEYGDSAMGLDMGMIGHKDSGKIRATVKKEVSLLKKQRKDGSATRGVGLGTNSVINGLSSSLSFTPIQGIELVNPTANLDKVKAANAKWFSSNSGFLSAVPK